MSDEPTRGTDETSPSGIDDLVFNADGLIPVVIQDAGDGDVLMVAWMNREALEHTIESGDVWFYSRSRQRFWRKGEESGNTLRARRIRYDCDGDVLLITAEIAGQKKACHTGRKTCFYRELPLSIAPR
jgi:phosphoribosyl-AMP cyclohydrolase